MRRPDPVPPGLVVVDKPAGWTSHDVVARARRLAGTRKVGHAGTLDPMATGVLVLGVDRATRLLGHLLAADKEYLATIRLGESTVTDDAEGDVTGSSSASSVSEADVRAELPALTGEVLQVPSSVSAIKVDGVRSYAKVRAGQDVELVARPVRISTLDAGEVRRAAGTSGVPVLDVDVRVVCSSGTYVRAIARDLGAALGLGGHLTMLRRTRVGAFGLDVARSLEELETSWSVLPLDEVARAAFPSLDLTDERARDVRVGRRLSGVTLPTAGPVAVFAPSGEFLALYEQDGGDAKAIAVFASV